MAQAQRKTVSQLSQLSGQLERVTFQNTENDYVVARVRVKGYTDLVTVVGNITSPTPGEILNMSGEWISHPKFGDQFKVLSYTTSIPASVAGIAKYLGSGLIKGIGPVMAKRIVAKFGESTLEIIENRVDRLLEIPGIGKQRVDMIGKAWSEQKEIRTVMLFLQSNGVSSSYASKIYRQYGNESISIVVENPYRLAYDISGIGFVTADQIAQKLGFEANSPQRAEAGILFALFKLTEDGHTFYPADLLLNQAFEILNVDIKILEQALKSLENEQKIVIEDINNDDGDTIQAVFLKGYHIAEIQIADMLKNIKNARKRMPNIDPDQGMEIVRQSFSISLAERQEEAVRASVQNKVMVITGQPGTGKTTITRSILQIFSAFTNRILLAAPTGRAAKRMSEATWREAKTIHRLLEYNVAKGKFQKNDDYQLDCDLIIIDESSMIDTMLMYHLLKAIPQFATVIFIGDINQLPSVGAGSVLRDLIDSGTFPVIELNEIFRQARKSNIILNAHRINEGKFPIIDNGENSDFYFVEENESDKVLEKILSMVTSRIPNHFGYDSMTDIQVLTPMNRGVVGTLGLNDALQQALNPNSFEISSGMRKFRVDDKVMQIKNDYDKDVFNGDIGFITQIDTEEHRVVVNVDGRDVNYDYNELDELVLAYAVSIHKSQGSEYPVVVIPIVTAHYIMLAKNLIYTGVTRGKKLVVLIGSKKALFLAVKNDKTAKRFTRLRERLCE
ncbi:MAG: ATP-dependent RecD-like DNA helicase [Alphaproteobacteria bacterium]|nr:ATP-dependent RecD-like DNA helicase [Alphaproteobacteria bacterium]